MRIRLGGVPQDPLIISLRYWCSVPTIWNVDNDVARTYARPYRGVITGDVGDVRPTDHDVLVV